MNTQRVDLEVMDYSGPLWSQRGPYQLFFSVAGEQDADGKKRFREILQGPSIKAIIDDIGYEMGMSRYYPMPTHVHGRKIEGDVYKAVMAAKDLWL